MSFALLSWLALSLTAAPAPLRDAGPEAVREEEVDLEAQLAQHMLEAAEAARLRLVALLGHADQHPERWSRLARLQVQERLAVLQIQLSQWRERCAATSLGSARCSVPLAWPASCDAEGELAAALDGDPVDAQQEGLQALLETLGDQDDHIERYEEEVLPLAAEAFAAAKEDLERGDARPLEALGAAETLTDCEVSLIKAHLERELLFDRLARLTGLKRVGGTCRLPAPLKLPLL
jgi:hypothetical protein